MPADFGVINTGYDSGNVRPSGAGFPYRPPQGLDRYRLEPGRTPTSGHRRPLHHGHLRPAHVHRTARRRPAGGRPEPPRTRQPLSRRAGR
jgi:hypothetical protein